MTRSFQLLPDGDLENDGWTLVGSSVTEVWEIISTFHDDCYIRCPQYRGSATVSFPIDVEDLPEGAIIDSVTVFIRMKTAAGSGPRSVTVRVLSKENMSRYTSRTLFATSSFTTFEVGTYTKDPMGKAWDIHRLNKLRLRVFCLNDLFDSIRISQLYVRVNYHVKPKVQVTGPSGTSISPSPVVTWNYTHEEGEPQLKAQIRVFTAQQVAAATSFNPDTEPPVYDATQVGSAAEHAVTTTLNNNGYRVYVRAWSEHNAKSSWAHKDFTIEAPSPGVPGDDNAGIAGTPGVGVPTAVPDRFTSSTQIRMRDASNLLSAQQADFEIASDPLEYTAVNASIARSTAQAFSTGEASLAITAESIGDMSAETTLIDIHPDTPITFRSQVRAATSARTVWLWVDYYDDSFAYISSATPVSVTDSSSTWNEMVGTGTTPPAVAYAKLKVEVEGAANGEVHYIDHAGIMYGTNSAWTDGGHQSRNLLTSFLATGDDPASNVDTWEQSNAASTTARVSTAGTGANGLKCNQMTYVGSSGQISFKATGTVFTSPTSGTNYTLNKPAGVTDNDLLLAFVTSTEHSTITPPEGWTTVNTASLDDGSTDIALFILKRTATSSDPASWTTGKVSVTSSRRTAVVVAYSGAAHADDQFIAENVRMDSSGDQVHRTQIVNNTDPNAWRVAAFAASDDASGASFTANETAPPTSSAPPISFVAASTKWVQESDTSSYTIQRPSGVKEGDLMIASVCFSGKINTVNVPSGWTLVRRTHKSYPGSDGSGDAHSGDVTLAILKRTAGASEPTSWTASHSDWGQPKVSHVVAYRNAANASQQFIVENAGTASNTRSVTTAEVTNTDSKAWRVCVFGATTSTGSSWSDGDVTERCDSSSNRSNFPDTVLSISDSNGQVSTGTHKRTAKTGQDFFSAVGWIGIIKPLSAPPAQAGNETERVDNNNGSSNPWMSTAVYDSNGVIPAGNTSLYGQFAPGSGDTANSMASWIGIIKPAASTAAGVVSAQTNTWVDISEMDPDVLELAGGKVTVISSFLGSTDGTPILGVEFARANQSISDAAANGNVFNTSSWTKSWATFTIPDGTTRLRPVLSATDRQIGDSVRFDRVGLMLGAPAAGETPVWRNGTARPEHPVWSKPVIQYADDIGSGFGDWVNLPGQKVVPPAFLASTGQLAYIDHSIIPLNVRKYRVQTVSFGLLGELFSSNWGPESNEVSFSALNWWLKDFTEPGNNLSLRVKYEDISISTDNTAAVFHPLGEDYPVVVTEGYKASSLTISVFCDRQEEASLYTLLRSNRTLLLQSDTDYAWWVRPVDALTTNNLAVSHLRRTTDPIKVVTVKFVEVKPEE